MTNYVTANGTTYNDGDTAPNNMGAGGFRTNQMPMLADVITDLAGKLATGAGQVTAATTQAGLAAAAAATALAAPGTNATSSTSLAVGIGSKSLTIQAGKSLVAGMNIVIADSATPTNAMFGQVMSYNSGTGALVANIVKITGSGTVASWVVSISGPAGISTIVRSPRTSNTVLGVADIGTLIDATSGSYPQTLTAAAILGNGWYAEVGNSGSGFVTLTPNGAEKITVSGVAQASWVLWPGEMGQLVCNGSGFNYYQITKGEITQTIGTPVASVSFATGLAYRRRLSLSIENLSSSGTVLPEMKINNTSLSLQKQGISNINGTVASGNNGVATLGGGNDIIAGATGIQRLSMQALLTPGVVNTFATLMSRHTTTANGDAVQSVICNWLGISEATIASIDIVSSGANMATGTFVLREL